MPRSVTHCIDVVSEPFISIPNVFTPIMMRRMICLGLVQVGIPSFQAGIYDRRGLKMYEWNDVTGGWDGNASSGNSAPAGNYFYIITYTDSKDVSKTEKGFLSLFRN